MSVQPAAMSVKTPGALDSVPLAVRYGHGVLTHGYTPTPNLVRQAWPALGATYAAYFLYETIISYQRSAAPPAIYVAQLAADLQIDPRRIRALTAQLVGLGLLAVGRAIDGRNLYDFRPLYARVEAQAQARAGAAATTARQGSPACAGDTKAALSVRASGRKPAAYEEEPKNTRFDSIPPTPCDEREDPDEPGPERQAVATAVAALGAALGDVAPRSSATRALRTFELSGLTAAVFVQLAYEASRVTQRRQRKAPPIVRPMAYWFDVLRVLLDDQAAQDTTPASPPARRPRATTRPPSLPPAPASPAPQQTADEWGQVRAALAEVITAENYARWFAPTHQVHYTDGALTVAVPDAFHLRWLDERLRAKIEACAAPLLPGTRVLFVVEARA